MYITFSINSVSNQYLEWVGSITLIWWFWNFGIMGKVNIAECNSVLCCNYLFLALFMICIFLISVAFIMQVLMKIHGFFFIIYGNYPDLLVKVVWVYLLVFSVVWIRCFSNFIPIVNQRSKATHIEGREKFAFYLRV